MILKLTIKKIIILDTQFLKTLTPPKGVDLFHPVTPKPIRTSSNKPRKPRPLGQGVTGFIDLNAFIHYTISIND